MRSLFLFPALHSLTVTELCQQFSSIAQCHITLCLDFSLILCSICSTRKNLNMSSILSSLVKFDHWSPENTYQDTQRQPSGPCCSWEFSHWCFGVKVKVQTWELYQSSNVTLQPDPCRFLQTLHFFQLQFSFCLPSLRCVDSPERLRHRSTWLGFGEQHVLVLNTLVGLYQHGCRWPDFPATLSGFCRHKHIWKLSRGFRKSIQGCQRSLDRWSLARQPRLHLLTWKYSV